MNKLVMTIVMAFSFNAFAGQDFQLEEGDSFLSAIEGTYEVQHLAPRCPVGALCGPVTNIVVRYNLGGCLDRAVTYDKVTYDDGIYNVYITAIRVLNEQSLTALCTNAPTHVQRVFIGSGLIGEDSIRVHFMEASQ